MAYSDDDKSEGARPRHVRDVGQESANKPAHSASDAEDDFPDYFEDEGSDMGANTGTEPEPRQDESNGGFGRAVAPLPAAVGGRRDYSASMPSARERNVAFVVAGLCAVLTVILVVWGISSAFGGSGDDGSSDAVVAADEGSTQQGDGTEGGTTTLTLTMAGDMLLHPSVYESGYQSDGSYDLTHLFAHTGEALSGDIQIVSQETPLAGSDYAYGYYPVFNAPQAVGDAEATAGFNVVLKASEHALDEGYAGLHSELEFWSDSHPDVAVLGVRDVEGDDPGSFDDVYVYEKDGFTVAILNYTADTGSVTTDSEGAVATLDEDLLTRNVEEAKRQADIVVVCPHWGYDGYTTVTTDQTQLAQLCLSLGVDVVIGTHPHVLQPVELLTDDSGNQMVCYWSIGSFISGNAGDYYNVGGIAQLAFSKDADGNARVMGYGLTPVVTHKASGTDEGTYLLSDYTDELASTNQNGLSVSSAESIAANALGDAYDSTSKTLWVDL